MNAQEVRNERIPRFGQRRQSGCVELAGQRSPRQSHELLVTGVAFVVDADNALNARRLAVGAGKPAAGFLDPLHGGGGIGAHAIFDAVGRALSAVNGR
jgi:hypothetical protein